jgi:alpha-L-fucosidase 2
MKTYIIAVITSIIIFHLNDAVGSDLKDDINWETFLGQHDMIWQELPKCWNDGAYVGNGQLGIMVYASMDDNRLDLHLGRADVTDHRKAPDKKSSMGITGTRPQVDYCRLDLGRLVMRPVGKIKSGRLHLSLWNAEITGEIETTQGTLSLRILTLRQNMVHVIEVKSTERNAQGALCSPQWSFLPEPADSPNLRIKPDETPKDYVLNPKPVLNENEDYKSCVQTLQAGGDYATVYRVITNSKTKDAIFSTVLASTANEVPLCGHSVKIATNDIQAVEKTGVESALEKHREAWHQIYPRSFVSIPDAQMEGFYWIQIYKFASAVREGGPALDLLGPWFKLTTWPSIWWNLNIQLTYWLPNASNHPDFGKTFIALMDDIFELRLNSYTRDGKSLLDLGDFAWVLHNYWLYYSYLGDKEAIKTKWLPKAKKVLEEYRKMLKTNDRGIYEIMPMKSPEYNDDDLPRPNTTYNLSLIHWLINASLEVSDNDPELMKWKEIGSKLIPYPVDKNGLMISSNQSFDMSHRHYSHLIALFPLFQLSPDKTEDRELVNKSVEHFMKIDNGQKLTGYSFTGAASLYAALGMGNEAYENLHYFLNGDLKKSILLLNTHYVERGGKNPCIETPLSHASAMLELLLQSWGNKIRVFPAVPEKWNEAAFSDLRAQGGFLVSAVRREGKTQWVSIFSEKGEPCYLKMTDWKGAIKPFNPSRDFIIKEIADGEYQIDLRAGERITLGSGVATIDPIVRVIPHPTGSYVSYGLPEGKGYPKKDHWDPKPLPDRSLSSDNVPAVKPRKSDKDKK